MGHPDLQGPTVLVELGWLHDAELAVADALDRDPESLEALSLFAKIKHMRGELSQALVCWAQIHARAAAREMGRMQLRALLHLADDPTAGAGEFAVLGQYQLARKPARQLALEHAFATFRARRPAEAKAQCLAVASRYRADDPESYKLAVLAAAWISQLSGDLEDAASALERLGKERGFETDPDRLLSIGEVYEAIGTPERLRAAINVYNHLRTRWETDGSPKVSLIGRLAALHRRLGHPDADRLEREHLIAFRHRMHRADRADAARAAADQYIPLARLHAAALDEPVEPTHHTGRSLAIARALDGDLDAARDALATVTEPLDRKYRGDVALLAGDRDAAGREYVEALAAEPDDVRLLGVVLDEHARAPLPQVAAYLVEPQVFEAAERTLRTEIELAPLRASAWRQLAALLRLRDDPNREADRCDERYRALADAAHRRNHPIGRVMAAGVYQFVGTARGLIHEVWADREAVAPGRGGALPVENILGNLTPDLRDGVRNVFLGVRAYAMAKFPQRTLDLHDYRYLFKLPKEDEPSGGLSAGLPMALAFLSVFVQRPVPQDVASTGMLVADAHDVLAVHPVGDIDYKVEAAYHRNLRGLLVPSGNRPLLEQSARVPAQVRDAIAIYVPDLDAAVRAVWGAAAFTTPA